MAKKKVSDKIQARFDKPQFQPGDAVFFSWLGQKQYGHVTKIKTKSWGIQYTVENGVKRRYPCGIQIAGQRTQYDVGCIFYEETKQLGRDEIESRIDTSRTVTTVSINSGRQKNQSTDDDRSNQRDTGKTSTKNTRSRNRKGSSTEDVVDVSAGGMSENNTRKRKNSKSELTDAIQKQRNFLNGFVKK